MSVTRKSCITGSTSASGSRTRTAHTTATDQVAPTVAAAALDPRSGDRARVVVTPAAAGASHATASQDGPGSARPTMIATGADVASTPAVRSSSSRTAGCGVTVTSSCEGSASPPKEAATPATGANGATKRKMATPSAPENIAAAPANTVTPRMPRSHAPANAGTAAI